MEKEKSPSDIVRVVTHVTREKQLLLDNVCVNLGYNYDKGRHLNRNDLLASFIDLIIERLGNNKLYYALGSTDELTSFLKEILLKNETNG
jgi:hypothetical protein